MPARARPATVAFFDALGDLGHRLEVAVRGDREARLDDVDAHLVEEVGDLELLLQRHGGAGHCSPSRRVVSKIRTRSLADLGSVEWSSDLVLRACAALGALSGSFCMAIP